MDRQPSRRAELETLKEEELDELVHECKAAEAAWINNSGRDEQIEFILEFEMEE